MKHFGHSERNGTELTTLLITIASTSFPALTKKPRPGNAPAAHKRNPSSSFHLSLRPQESRYNTTTAKNSALMTVMSSNDIKYRRSPRISHLPQKHDNYEPLEVGFNGASFSGAVFNLSTTIVGAGIMALPSTVKQLGLIPGIIMILMGAALTETSIDMILRFGRASKTATYSGVVADSFGGFWRTLLQICIVINNLGMLIVYMIIIGMNFLLANLVF